MSFNKNTWSKDHTGAPGIKLLGAADALRQGFSPKYQRAVTATLAPKGKPASAPKAQEGQG